MKTPLSRISEIILSLGIPAVAYISSSGPLKVELILPTVVLIMLGAWHVVTVNDDSFAVHTSFFDLFLEKKHRCAKLLAPSAIVITVPFMPLQAAAVLA
ncbi:MAG: hypothetical protein KAG97_01500, partial [Victivallales bacterium]|nr:hypothetical protein [Victivallales bacterium]